MLPLSRRSAAILFLHIRLVFLHRGVPEPFCLEIWALLAEDEGSYRIACMTGRGALAVINTHEWCFTLFCGAAEVVLKGPKSRTNEWQHVVGTYDGTMMRLFINGRPTARMK